ncbi:phosphatase PAP2 family protein [Muricauda sp. 2012CJ35-5]|uniref:Phosphatase PAP2 family protein n=1 Tax=Flagellimonas spongiicola TaxID=2942208 RepID=A0ABT0PQP2_9FLAO|nr:phosphatase PAP2 family protein [Allomuricauda spongiicola]MCL6273704.1 phosphatase PAP2 family protein [Allomuricauda spongiicola]
MKNNYLFTAVLLLIQTSTVFTQQFNKTTSDSNWEKFTYDLNSILGGVGHAYTRPLSWENNQVGLFAGTILGTIGLYSIDDDADRWFRNQEPHIPKLLKDYGWYYGNPQNNYAFNGIVYLTGLFSKNDKIRRTGVLMISSATATGVLQQISKSLVGRARPRSGLNKNDFRPFQRDSDFHSFPSGHTALAISNAHALAKQFKNPWIKSGIYVLGSIPPLTRLWNGAHWLTDIALSVVLSVATVEAIDKYLDGRYQNQSKENVRKRKKRVAWRMIIKGNGLGVAMNF